MMTVFRSTDRFDIAALEHDAAVAEAMQPFESGAYGHCISLPRATDLAATYRTHHNNIPFSGALDRCPAFRQVFSTFKTGIASFRLLRRVAHSAYGLHDDRDKGSGLLRLQIPIRTNDRSYIAVLKNGVELEPLARQLAGFSHRQDNLLFDFQRFCDTFGDRFDLFAFAPGHIHYFDTDTIRTAINAGKQDRVVLAIDLVRNAWLDQWLVENLSAPVPATPQSALVADAVWTWNALKHGLLSHPRIDVS